MKTHYTNLDIRTTIDDTDFLALNIVLERFLRSMPRHSHGQNSYEMHYIPYGKGRVWIDGAIYQIEPNTLYMTGPHVEHEQIPYQDDPMVEYCIYFKLQKNSSSSLISPSDGFAGKSAPKRQESVAQKFENCRFWFGQDSQELYPVMQQLFFELEHKYVGYTEQVEALLKQCVVKLVRNYENKSHSKLHFSPSSLVDSKYLIVEESFLYEYETITLESLASRLALSTRQTERFLKDYYGKTFLQKKTEARMSIAKIYLEDPDMSVAEIAERLNYSSSQHFSYAFKQYYGISASEYRRNLQSGGMR